jgi:alpha-D-xyloside xylohydrolase
MKFTNEFPEDPTCAYLDRQYMLGDALLIAPVMSEEMPVELFQGSSDEE